MKFLWDTNIVIYYLQNQLSPRGEAFIEQILSKSDPALSVITEIELLSWKGTSEEGEKVVLEFLHEVQILELETEIKHVTAEIRKTYGTKLPDAIIAATALHHNIELLTRNVKDFQKIENLRITNPFDEKPF